MASMRDIKRRKQSIQSTGQITKAMKLVSTVRFQKAKSKAENAKPYFDHMYEAVFSILGKSQNIQHRYLTPGNSDKKAVIVVTANRGLAGGFNTNITKLITRGEFAKEDIAVYAVGRKGRDILKRRGYKVVADFSDVINEPTYSDAMQIGQEVLDAFAKGEIGEIYMAYTSYKNTVSHTEKLIKLLPVESDASEEENDKFSAPMNYENDEEETLDIIIPKYINSLIYGALMESVASENAARMTAMDNATNNAEEMISELALKYNRARQGSITQELTEIIGGANAIS
ncbi:MAG: ATP synthase F1 subunit gamma [Lachnospiraceae bacterium]|nr:ATP synthase F1 subunit gamma [Lachnospira sp.]MBR6696696.1 ATP synthase F1 subunit gamma [Lachnospiraceae bacterium]